MLYLDWKKTFSFSFQGRMLRTRVPHHVACGLWLSLLLMSGCGSIREHRATEQMLLSDAVDRSVASIDFSPLADKKVFLDTSYIPVKNDGAVTTGYVVSALRQQMLAAGCLIQNSNVQADYVVEARVGTLGSDAYEINYGIPANNSLNAAASVVTTGIPLPSIPEISFGKRTKDAAAAKIAVFAYERESKTPIWQSGTSIARSEVYGTWLLGAGPFQRGTMVDGMRSSGGWLGMGPRNKAPDLAESDYTFRGTKIWHPELREQVADGSHLARQPSEEKPNAEAQGTSGEQISRRDQSTGKPQ